MVDSSADEGHLRATGEGAFDLNKKRYNVAVSRARDQILMVHSFDLINLRSDDLRHQLLQHIQNPRSSIQAYEQEVDKTESPFEKEVLKRLTASGFKVRTQWEVGYYRIDMVVEGGGKRLAVECDGDRYHPIEKLADDMERQSVLERLGWQFARIRGSAFFRDPDLAMKSVLERLEEIGILPEIHRPEEYSTDMTLINELDQLINEGIDLIDDDDQVSVKEKENSSSETRKDKASSIIKLEELILSYGQAVHISDLCKDISIDRGYKRLSSNLRRKIELEIKAAVKKGMIIVEDDMVQLVRSMEI
jgi:very-short-patch-repair endonuclease